MNNTSLLKRTLKAMIESRDEVANSIGEIPSYKADYERRFAQATAQLAEHDACIKDLEAAIAEQAKPQEPIGYLAFRNGAPAWDDDCVCQDAVYPIDGDDDRASVAIYTRPQALEPMSEDRKKAMSIYEPPFKFNRGYIHDSAGHMVADDDQVQGSIAAQVRGWGYINGRFPEPEKLQDEIGQMIADALNAYYEHNIGVNK